MTSKQGDTFRRWQQGASLEALATAHGGRRESVERELRFVVAELVEEADAAARFRGALHDVELERAALEEAGVGSGPLAWLWRRFALFVLASFRRELWRAVYPPPRRYLTTYPIDGTDAGALT